MGNIQLLCWSPLKKFKWKLRRQKISPTLTDPLHHWCFVWYFFTICTYFLGYLQTVVSWQRIFYHTVMVPTLWDTVLLNIFEMTFFHQLESRLISGGMHFVECTSQYQPTTQRLVINWNATLMPSIAAFDHCWMLTFPRLFVAGHYKKPLKKSSHIGLKACSFLNRRWPAIKNQLQNEGWFIFGKSVYIPMQFCSL